VTGFRVLLPIKTPNPSNGAFGTTRAAMFAEASMRKSQHAIALAGVGAALRSRGLVGADVLPCTVTLTRIAFSNGLDEHDNLRSALKKIVDGIADALGLASDRTPLVQWEYAQRRGKPKETAVLVEVRLHPKEKRP
jgi:hypothetical protein